MYETDSVPAQWVARLNKMDEVWVPTHFHIDSFSQSGVDPLKLFVVPEAVDGNVYAPSSSPDDVQHVPWDPARDRSMCDFKFSFLSVFKWESRKGWDVLLEAFFREFRHDECVRLVIKTQHFYTEFDASIKDFAITYSRKHFQGLDKGPLPELHVIERRLPYDRMPSLYRSADAFVLPSRGEGWGRPVAEAMATGLPTIATNWSGMTEYLNERNGFPIPVVRITSASDAPQGHSRAEPSLIELRRIMRRVVSEKDREAAQRGARARKDMLEKYSPVAVAQIAKARLKEMLATNGPITVRSDDEL